MKNNPKQENSLKHVLFGSLIGTTIEFFDFYIYANAAVLVFPQLFFPGSDSTTSVIESLATFAVAFFARPIGSAVFGHYGDKIGRKTTLVVALLTMGVSTVCIGLLPTYASIGILAPILLTVCRFGQGLGLGGEWGGAVLLAIENAPPNKRAWYGMFPQLGAPIGLLLSGGTFLILGDVLTNEQFFDYGWRIPFIASSVLVVVGFYIRLKITETPSFVQSVEAKEQVKIPLVTILKKYQKELIFGTFAAVTTFVVFYLMTVFSLSWATTNLGFARRDFLIIQLFSVLFFGFSIPISAIIADKFGRRKVLIAVSIAIVFFGFLFAAFLDSGSVTFITIFLCLGMTLMGLTYGPLGTFLSELFPTEVRYSGASLTFNLAGIIGAAFAPMIAIWFATHYGLTYVGYYLSIAAVITVLALLFVSKKIHKF
ncbi:MULTISPECIES: MFS transporter [Flavobacterium]|uniref:MHS family MFS transporter n=2 Tax=Flavobacterium TaxID=237 RepID=A0A941AYV1_9FLAO|nr:MULTISPECIES: MFS transporter [Flavobacterium]MBP4138207.1 MHS family MFS transporter [Flavobacterium geliluteum]MDX6183337.1 MFS transporter [Flavobacterium sp. Fl-33]MDX6186621.1 MFS transporter [Flavobacterium sp. Fl-77]UFH38610.1 MHS family MFS transporter [Flavobacterium sp. F-70]